MPADLKPHKYAELLPMMSPAEFQSLKADLAVNPQRDPIMRFAGQILDGRNREKALRELGKTAVYEDFKGTEADALQYVYGKANHRHMSESQKAAAAVNFLPLFESLAAGRQSAAGGKALVEPVPPASNCQKLVSGKTRKQMGAKLSQTGRKEMERLYTLHVGWLGSASGMKEITTSDMQDRILDRMYGAEVPAPAVPAKGKARDQAGSLFGVSGRYVQDAKLVFERDPKLFRQVFDGALPLTRAKRIVYRSTKRKSLAALAKAAPAVAEAVIVDGDCLREMEKFPAKSFRLIFADPPYNLGIDYGKGSKADQLPPEKYVQWVANWIVDCKRMLTDDGSMWVLISDEFAADYGLMLRHEFTIRNWIKWYETFGVNCNHSFNRTSRHLFYCTKNKADFIFNHDAFSRPSDRQTKYKDLRAAEGGKLWDDVWQIPRLVENAKERVPGFPTQLPLALVEPIVRGCTEPGDTVFDPFTGSGTTAVAAVLNGRKFVGTEISKKFAEMARLRVRAAVAEAAAAT